MNDMLPYLAIAFSGLTLLIMTGEKIFGGGNALAAKFAQLDKDTVKSISDLRNDLTQRIDLYEDNYKVGLDAITANIHALQLAALEFRARMAEEYVRQGGLDHIEKRMSDGFDKVERRMGELQDMIMYANPDVPHRGGTGAAKSR